MKKKLLGNIVDPLKRIIYYGQVHLKGTRIERIERIGDIDTAFPFILPGLIDSHIHIESSMLPPSSFAALAVRSGTVCTVSDPHEIANVLGLKGVEYMIEDAGKVPLKINFGAPSCVPATFGERSGAVLNASDVSMLMERDEIKYLSEMMNFPGVIMGDKEVLAKIGAAEKSGKPVDGHAPGLKGPELEKYISAGISTDHECTTIEEAEEKIKAGMFVQIREGSAAKSFEHLYPLLNKYPGSCMLCSDDLHPDDLEEGHINKLIKRGVGKGINIFDLLMAAVINPANHYKLDACIMREGDPADIILCDSLKEMNVLETWIDGEKVFSAREDIELLSIRAASINNFNASPIRREDIFLDLPLNKARVIRAYDGDLYTSSELMNIDLNSGGQFVSGISEDIMKIVVINRYEKAEPAIGFITGFGMNEGALASSIAHDSHNIVAVGKDDDSIIRVVNEIIRARGGIAIYDGRDTGLLPLDIAGLMSSEDPKYVAARYRELNARATSLSTSMKAPFMTLAFMSLLVIPELKIGDRGLFDVNSFTNVDLKVR